MHPLAVLGSLTSHTYIQVLLGIYCHTATHTYVVLDDIDDDHHPQAWAVGVPDSN